MFPNQSTINIILASSSFLLFLIIIWQQITLHKLKKKQSILFQGKTAKNLETIILKHQDAIIDLSKQTKRLFEITNDLNILANTGLNKVGMIRFNPFKNLGGNQSFSIAFLNSHLNGLVITSIYHEGGSRFYSKTITAGKSQKEFPLTEEEQKAIALASGQE